ncbi:MAG: hypothetical protein AAF756_14205 [Pseudomonadota bacterium]
MSTSSSAAGRATIGFVLLLITFVVLCWSGVLDGYTLRYLDQSLLGSGAIYASARSINAAVSVLQGTEVSAVFVSFSVGEVLDPVNDLIERFSGLMLLALGSLALQHLLLTIVSHEYINTLLSLICVALALLWFKPGIVSKPLLVRLAAFLIAIRIALPLITLCTQAIEILFLASSESQRYENIQNFQRQLEDANNSLGVTTAGEDQLDPLQADLDAAKAAYEIELVEQATLEKLVEVAKSEAEALPQPPLWKPWEQKSGALELAEKNLTAARQRLREQRGLVVALDNEIDQIENAIECINLRSEGKSCSIFESAAGFAKRADPRPHLSAVVDRIDDFVKDLVELLISLLFRSVLLPLAALWLFVKLTIWGSRALADSIKTKRLQQD